MSAVTLLSSTGAVSAEEAEQEATVIELSDENVLVDGTEISADTEAAVYAGAEIIYYKAGQDAVYGEGDEDDGHTEEEAAEQTVITITQPGTYKVTGSISKGQIAVDLGEESREDSSAVVNLILDNAEITCTVAPSVVVYNAYECGSDDTETASMEVDTTAAGFNLILADDSTNVINGSHVAKIYKEGTTQEEVDAGEAKKAWKFDAAIDSLVSFNITGEEEGNGKLNVTADNEGISSALHMTVNGGEITINSSDDAINTSEDYVSVLTINDGIVTCDSGLGSEGDGIDSNGWIVINGGYIISCANGGSADSGVDADMGIYTNGGTVMASGNMYDEVSGDSEQPFMVLSFAEKIEEGQILMIKDSAGNPVTAFSAVNAFQTLVYSCDTVTEGDYTLYKVSSVTGDLNGSIYTNITEYEDEVQLQYSSSMMMGFGGRGGMDFGGQNPENMESGERPELPEGMEPGQMPEGMEPGEVPEMPEGIEQGERPEPPEGMESGQMPEGMEADEIPQGGDGQNQESSTTFTVSGITNQFAQIGEAAADEEITEEAAVEETVSI